jgi:phosphate transport system substrate-binding protein
MRRLAAVALLLALSLQDGAVAAGPVHDDPAVAFVADLPSYRPGEQVAGTIRLWGHGSFRRDFMGRLVRAWIERFHAYQPRVVFENRMYGTASAIGALYTDAGDIAILGEEISPAARRAFLRARGYEPTGIEIATGSLDVNYYDYAHMIFVHRDNPLTRLSLAQLEGIFGTENRRGAGPIRTWGDLGLSGDWAEKPIQPYGWKTDVDFALFFRERVLEDSHRWNPSIREFVHGTRPDGRQYDHGQRILDALSQDRCGIAISNLRYATGGVKALALAWKDGGPWCEANVASLVSRCYPLTRIIPAYIDRPPGRPVDPAQREFLRFVLSREGQAALLDLSGYLPLGAAFRARELGKLQ